MYWHSRIETSTRHCVPRSSTNILCATRQTPKSIFGQSGRRYGMLEWKRQNGITHHFCQYGQHNAPLDQFTEETLGCCNDCLVTLRAETQRQHENHQVWLVWRDTPEGRLVRACADVVNEEKALDF